MSSPASSGASAAPSASPASSPAQGTSSGHSPGGDGGFDPSEAIREARQARQETSKLRSSFDKTTKDFQQTREVLDRVQKAFVPEEQSSAPDPVADLEEQMDYYLEQAMEAKARGQAIPLTTNLALRFFQSQIENHKTQQALMEQIKELKGGVNQANDPERSVNDFAYANMENFIQNSLDSLYGAGPEQTGVKRNVYQGVVNTLQADLKELQAKAPQIWDQVRRNPAKLQQIVQRAVQQIVPPRAMQMIQEENLQNTPMGEGELWAAFREADQIKDPGERMKIKRQIRQDILEASINRRNPRGKRR